VVSQNFLVLKAPDSTVIECFAAFEKVTISTPSGHLAEADFTKVSKANHFAISSTSAMWGTCQVSFSRGIKVGGSPQPSTRYDSVQIGASNNQNRPKIDDYIAALNELSKHFSFFEADALSGDATAETIMGTFTTSFAQVSATMQTQLNELQAYRTKLLTDLDEREDERAKKAEEDHQGRVEEHQDLMSRVEAERASLHRESHMHERRELRRQIVENLQTSLGYQAKASDGQSVEEPNADGVKGHSMSDTLKAGLSSSKRTLLILSICAFIALIFGIGGLNAFAVTSDHSGTEFWALVIRGTLCFLVTAGAALVAINWLKREHIVEGDRREALERQLFDINRASWVIETSLEVQKDSKGGIPEAWIEWVTRNLFETPENQRRPDDERIAVLSGLLGMSSKMKFGPDGAEVEIEKSGLKGTKKAADRA